MKIMRCSENDFEPGLLKLRMLELARRTKPELNRKDLCHLGLCPLIVAAIVKEHASK